MMLLLRGAPVVVVLGWGTAEEVDMETARMVVVGDTVSKLEQCQGLEGKQICTATCSRHYHDSGAD